MNILALLQNSRIVDHSISFMADTLAVFLNWCPQLDSIVVLVFVVKFWLSLTNTIRSKSKYHSDDETSRLV